MLFKSHLFIVSETLIILNWRKDDWQWKKFKNVVIGFGKAGKTLAKFLAQHDEEVLLIERSDQMYGGTCINVGCLPSKI